VGAEEEGVAADGVAALQELLMRRRPERPVAAVAEVPPD